MSAIEVMTETKINHAELGAEVWEWASDQQAAFLVGMANAFRADSAQGIFQIHYIGQALRMAPGDLEAVRWLNDRLTDYLKEEDA